MSELFSTPELSRAQPDSSSGNGTPTAPDLRLRFEFSPQGIGTLFGALAKARKSFKPVVKNSKNPFFKSKYADLAEVLAATTDALSDNDIAIVQPPACPNHDRVEIHTFMAHKSGEWVRSILDMPVGKMDAQGVGSSITYGRRYAYSGMVSVASEEDDDGNSAGANHEYEKDFDQRTQSQQLIGNYQINAWNAGIKQGVRTQSQIDSYLKKLGISQVEDMPKMVFNDAIKWLLNPKIEADLTDTLKDSVATVPKKQLNFSKLFALAKEKGVPESDVKTWCYEQFGIKSMLEMTPQGVKEAEQWLNTLA